MLLKKSKHIFYIILAILIFSSCEQNNSIDKYNNSANQFNKIYFETVDSVDLTNTKKSIEVLHADKNIKKIDELGNIIKVIKENIPPEKERLYQSFKERLDNLVFLKKSYAKTSKLSNEDRRRIGQIFISIGMDKENYKDKGSTILWK